MATITMQELKRSLGENDTVSIQYRSTKQAGKEGAMGETSKRSMAATKQLIKDCIFTAGGPLKFREIARLIGRKPTPYLRLILNDMIESNELTRQTDSAIAGNMDRFWYGLPDK